MFDNMLETKKAFHELVDMELKKEIEKYNGDAIKAEYSIEKRYDRADDYFDEYELHDHHEEMMPDMDILVEDNSAVNW